MAILDIKLPNPKINLANKSLVKKALKCKGGEIYHVFRFFVGIISIVRTDRARPECGRLAEIAWQLYQIQDKTLDDLPKNRGLKRETLLD